MSVDTAAGDSNGDSFAVSVSADGGHVAFVSAASDLTAGDGNGTYDVFVRDLHNGTTIRASVDMAGGDANSWSFYPSISADGRYVAFQAFGSDVVPDDDNATDDIVVRDLLTGTTTRASVDTTGASPDGASYDASISADGRYVAFRSEASDLVPGDGNGAIDVFVRDLQAGTTTRVSVDATGGDANGASEAPSISADGRYVAFRSAASDLVAGDGNGETDVFVRNLQSGSTTRVSVDTAGGDPNGSSWGPSISGDGRLVAFVSTAWDMVPADANGTQDIFVRDLQAGTTTRASVDTAGGDPDSWSDRPALSPDGRSVAFNAAASDLVAGDGNGVPDVFVRDLQAGTTSRVSVDSTGHDANDVSGQLWERAPAISADGRYVAFDSKATDLVAGDRNGVGDVFRADRGTLVTTCGGYEIRRSASGLLGAPGWFGTVKLGTTAPNTITGTSGKDLMAGLAGNDTLKGVGGADIICGQTGLDRLEGGGGKDILYGLADADKLYGGDGADLLYGGEGGDLLAGQSGSPDRCEGGAGTDTAGAGCEVKISIP